MITAQPAQLYAANLYLCLCFLLCFSITITKRKHMDIDDIINMIQLE